MNLTPDLSRPVSLHYLVQQCFAALCLGATLIGCTEADRARAQAGQPSEPNSDTLGSASLNVPEAGQTQLVIDDEFFGRVGVLDEIVDFKCTPSNGHLILAIRRNSTPDVVELVVDGDSTAVDDFSTGSITFNPSGEHYAYVVLEEDRQGGTRFRPIIDGSEGKPADALSNVVFSPNGRRTAYLRQQGGTCRLIVDGVDRTPADAVLVLPDSLTFSPDSRRLACVAVNVDTFALVVDGAERVRFSNRLDPFQPPMFSPDSKDVAFVFVNENKDCQIFCGDRVSKPVGNVSTSTMIWSPDSTRFAYGARNHDTHHLVLGDEQTGDFEGIGMPTFCSSGNRWGCVFRKDGLEVLIIDGQEVARHEAIFGPVFSADSSQLAFYRRENGAAQIVLNGEPGPVFDVIVPDHMYFSPNDRHFAYLARKGGKSFVVIDDKVSEPYHGQPASPIAFSPDGSRYAYAAMPKDISMTVVIDGEQGKPFDALLVPPTFSPDGRHVAYVARKLGSAHIVVNDDWSEPYDGIVEGSSIAYTAPDRFSVCMIHSGEFFTRTQVTIETVNKRVGQNRPTTWSALVADSAKQSETPLVDARIEAAFREGDVMPCELHMRWISSSTEYSDHPVRAATLIR